MAEVPAPLNGQSRDHVTVLDAYARMWKQGTKFNGRASRPEFWWALLVDIGVVVLLGALLSSVGVTSNDELRTIGIPIVIVSSLYMLMGIVPRLALLIRRFHDANRSGWWVLLGLIPYLGAFVLLIFAASRSVPAGQRFD